MCNGQPGQSGGYGMGYGQNTLGGPGSLANRNLAQSGSVFGAGPSQQGPQMGQAPSLGSQPGMANNMMIRPPAPMGQAQGLLGGQMAGAQNTGPLQGADLQQMMNARTAQPGAEQGFTPGQLSAYGQGGQYFNPANEQAASMQNGLNVPAQFAQQGYIDKGFGQMNNGQFQWTPQGIQDMQNRAKQGY